jgi:predicted nucleotidyltransferase
MHENLVRIKVVARCLKGLEQDYVFVGGATVSLYSTLNDVSQNIRPTDDVDVVIELASYFNHTEMDEKLRRLGFANDIESGVVCRYTIEGIIVDIMPTTSNILGFSNKWYSEGFKNAITYQLDDEIEILIFSAPYFLASKWEAHKSRGASDLRTSRDFEDMVYVFENCKDFDERIINGPDAVKKYLREELEGLLDHPDFEEALYSHMESVRYGADANKLIVKIKKSLGLL